MQELKRKFVIDVSENHNRIALLEDDQLVELHEEDRDATYATGNIYLSRVNIRQDSSSALFVEIGENSQVFLSSVHRPATRSFLYSQKFLTIITDDIKKNKNRSWDEVCQEIYIKDDNLEAKLESKAKYIDCLSHNDDLLVSIVKEPISTKPASVSTEICFIGHNLILSPFSEDLEERRRVKISKKIRSKAEVKRLKSIVLEQKPKGFMVTVRTAAEDKDQETLANELNMLLKAWSDCYDKTREYLRLANNNPNSGRSQIKRYVGLVYKEQDRVLSLIRENGNDFDKIIVNDKEVYKEIVDYVSFASLGKKKQVDFYDNKQRNIFNAEGVTHQMMKTLGRKVKLQTGKTPPNLIIEQTEAMHVIDVNSAGSFKKNASAEEIAVEVNNLAAVEIARQLRLRDMGGIIMIDFIDMRDEQNKLALYHKMCKLLQVDRAKPDVYPLTKLCLMQITRKRVRDVIHVKTEEVCPSCQGRGKISSSITFVETLKGEIEQFIFHEKLDYINVHVNPFIASHLTKGLFSTALKWRFSIGPGVKITSDDSMSFLQHKFYDKAGREIIRKTDKK